MWISLGRNGMIYIPRGNHSLSAAEFFQSFFLAACLVAVCWIILCWIFRDRK